MKITHSKPSRTKETAAQRADQQAQSAYDADLVRRFNADGDEAAFREIVERYYGRIVAAAHRMLRNTADAEDIAQETFIRAYRGLARFRGESSLASWLYCIALNLSRNRYWYFFRRRRHETSSLDQTIIEGSNYTLTDVLPDPSTNPRWETINREFSDLAAKCMNKMDRQQREILIQRNVQHQSYGQISAQLGVNVGTVKSRIARARVKLRELMLETAVEFDRDAEMAEFFEPTRSPFAPMAIAS